MSAKVFLIEDNEAEAAFTQKALEKSKVVCQFTLAENGLDAQEQLCAGYIPNLILLDLNMPVMDGREFLTWIKSDPRFKHLPVVVMTTSDDKTDIEESWLNQCAAYITKPVAMPEITNALKQLANFYFLVVHLPDHCKQVLVSDKNAVM